jgi:hypothetical protein
LPGRDGGEFNASSSEKGQDEKVLMKKGLDRIILGGYIFE